MGPSSIISKWNTCRECPGRFLQVKITGIRSASHCIGSVWPRNVRNNEPPNCSRLKTMVWRHIDQMMRTRNFGVRNEVVDRGSHQESKREEILPSEESGRVLAVEGTRTMFKRRLMQFQSWQTGTRRLVRRSETKRTIVLSRTILEGQDWRRGRKTIERIRKQRKRTEIPCRYRNCSNPSCVIWHPPVCQNCKSETGCKFERTSFFRHVEESPQISQRNVGEEGKFGSKHAVKFSKGTWHQIKIRERKGPSRGIIPKCEPHERGPCAPKIGERSQDETLQQERCVRREAWDLAKNVLTSSRLRKKLRLVLLLKQR